MNASDGAIYNVGSGGLNEEMQMKQQEKKLTKKPKSMVTNIIWLPCSPKKPLHVYYKSTR